ncbi:MAG: hypothetical protein IK095_05515, partial [Oscillospiraceae bacterium]|nr:hypothetical protein [Oscillospiraceae bacterium]
MREIDDRYPEYARPFAPIRRRRIRARLSGNEATLLQGRARHVWRMQQMHKYFTTGTATLIVILILLLVEDPPNGPYTPPVFPPIEVTTLTPT